MPDNVMRIELVADLGGSVSGVRQLADATRQLSQSQRQVSSSAQAAAPRITGPVSRLRAAEALRSVAQTPGEIEDVEIGIARAQLNLLRQRRRGVAPGGIMGQLSALVSSTRVGLGPGGIQVAPLVGRAFDVLRGANPLLAGLITAVVTLGAAAIRAAQQLREMGASIAASGGTAAQVGFLHGLGIPLGQIPAAAGGLRERLSTDPMAMIASSRLGLGPQPPGFLGQQNYTKSLIAHLDALRRVTNEEEQLRLARMLGLEGMVDLIRASDYMYQGLKRDAAIFAVTGAAPANVSAARDATVGLSRMGAALSNLLEVLTAPIVAAAGPALDLLANTVNAVSVALAYALDPITKTAQAFSALYNWVSNLLGGNNSATERNTQAIEDWTMTIKEVSGGGPRLRGALPAGLTGEAFNRNFETGALRFGAWQLAAG